MPSFDVDALLVPLPGDVPCGADPEYDADFAALERLLAVRGEQQFGKTIIPAEEPEWPLVHEAALALAQRTRDLRVAVTLWRAAARLDGLAGANRGMQLIAGLLDRYWDAVHPVLENVGPSEPTTRMNVLARLVAPGEGLADWQAAFIGTRSGLTVRQLLIATGTLKAVRDEWAPTAEGLPKALAELGAQRPGVADEMERSVALLGTVESLVAARLRVGTSPDFGPLRKLLQALAQQARHARPAASSAAVVQAPAVSEGAVAGSAAPPPAVSSGNATAAPLTTGIPMTASTPDPTPPPVSGAITNREDAAAALDRVCEWLDREEPGHPAPLLIRRARRLLGKSFLEILKDLVPDSVDQATRLAGPKST